MPKKPRKPCRYPGCPELTNERYCNKHKKEDNVIYNRSSRHFKHLYNTSRWKTLRKQFLQKHPLCEQCKKEGVIKNAEVVDHIKPHQGDEALFWNQDNWQALCKYHHDVKTASEDGRWGKKGVVYSYD